MDHEQPLMSYEKIWLKVEQIGKSVLIWIAILQAPTKIQNFVLYHHVIEFFLVKQAMHSDYLWLWRFERHE